MKSRTFIAVTTAALTSTVCSASSEIIHETEDPFGGPFGIIGFDIFTHQSVATRFTSPGSYTLDRVRPWFMNNSGTIHPSVTMTLRSDHVTEHGSFPGDEILESWTFNISTLGWDPQQETLESVLNPLLEEGKNYWIMAESSAAAMANPVWTWAQPDTGWMSICNTHPADPPGTCTWSPASTGAVVAVVVEGTPAVPSNPADLNGDGVVNVFDLLLLLQAWGVCENPTDCAADLNGDGVVNVFDLLVLLAFWG